MPLHPIIWSIKKALPMSCQSTLTARFLPKYAILAHNILSEGAVLAVG